jgi:hypothetical protein
MRVKKYKLSVGAVFKNESLNLKEWVEHYKNRGVEHIYLIDDDSEDNYKDVLESYIQQGFVTLYKNDIPKFPRVFGRQNTIYNKFFLPIINESEWFYVCDLDEFLYSPKHFNLIDALNKYKDYTALLVNWLCFNSNGNNGHPDSIVKSCTKRLGYNEYVNAPMPDGSYNRQVMHSRKYIINLTDKNTIISDINLHDITISPFKPVNVSYTAMGDDFDLVINHYYLQSREYWEKVKMSRGDCDNWHPDDRRDWNYFNALDVGDEIDTRLLEQNKKYIKNYE